MKSLTSSQRLLAIPVALGIGVTACSDTSYCTKVAVPALSVTARDAQTGAPICDATVVARDGDFEETLMRFPAPGCECQGAEERLGTYQVTASAPGYQPLTKTMVAAIANECNVETAHADFALPPE